MLFRSQLAGENAGAQLAARAAEFAEARQNYDALVIKRGDNTLYEAQQARIQADEGVVSADKTLSEIRRQLEHLEREIADKENRPARAEQAKRILRLRHDRRQMPADWCDASANHLIEKEWRDSTNIARRIDEIEARFADESWETDASVIVLRDKIRDEIGRAHV